MDWTHLQEKIILGFKTLITILLAWLGKEGMKKLKPALKYLKDLYTINERLAKTNEELLHLKQQCTVTNNKLMTAFMVNKNPIFIMDKKGDFIFVNDAWLELTGFRNPSDAYNRGYLQAIPDELIPAIEAMNKRFIEHPFAASGMITFRNRQTGNLIKTSYRTELVLDHENNFFLAIGRLDILTETP